MNELQFLTTWMSALKERLANLRDNPEDGSLAETVIITALLVAGALAIVGYLVGVFTTKAQSIKTS